MTVKAPPGLYGPAVIGKQRAKQEAHIKATNQDLYGPGVLGTVAQPSRADPNPNKPGPAVGEVVPALAALLDGKVKDIAARIAGIGSAITLEELFDLEEAGKARTGVFKAIDTRADELGQADG